MLEQAAVCATGPSALDSIAGANLGPTKNATMALRWLMPDSGMLRILSQALLRLQTTRQWLSYTPCTASNALPGCR